VVTEQPTRTTREIVSFVRRGSRMTPSQSKAWREDRQRYVLDLPRGATDADLAPEASLDLTETFGRDAPLIVEIGPGMGDSFVPMAQARPQANLLAFEVYQPAVAAMLIKLSAAEVDNVRICMCSGVDGLTRLVPDAAMDRLWTFFPDPWPKSRHHKRRLISPAFADLVAAKLKPGGRWRIATDWASYATHIREVLDEHPAFTNPHPGGWAPRWRKRPITKFERRGLDAGRPVFDLTYVRRDA